MAGLQVWLTVLDHRRQQSRSVGAGAVLVGGSSTAPISTDVAGVRRILDAPAGEGDVIGSGAVVLERGSAGEIRTRIRDVGER
jgi:hypothetical protein